MRKEVYIYSGNHGKLDGVEDYFSIIKGILEQGNVELVVSDKLIPNKTNILIDEFTSYIENKKLAKFKQENPNSKLIFVLTEFVERKWLVESFNHFGGVFISSFIALLNVYIPLRRKDFGNPKLSNILIALFYLPVFFVYACFSLVAGFAKKVKMGASRAFAKGKEQDTSFVGKHYSLIYLSLRYWGLRTFITHASEVIYAHTQVKNSFKNWKGPAMPKELGILHPVISEKEVLDNLFVNKGKFFEVTGSVTDYRAYWMKKIDLLLKIYGLHNLFEPCRKFSFADEKKKGVQRGAYSLHPPQTKKWRYSSPTRIYRALMIDHSLPVLTQNFNQHAIEKLCSVYCGVDTFVELDFMFDNRQEAFIELAKKINKYNQVAQAENQLLVTSCSE